MNIRHLLAGTAAVGVLSLGAAGVAVASTPSAPTAPTSVAAASKCAAATTRLQLAADLDHAAGLRLTLLQQALASAQSKGNATRVARIQARISKVTARQQKLESRMQKLEQRCSLPAPAAS